MTVPAVAVVVVAVVATVAVIAAIVAVVAVVVVAVVATVAIAAVASIVAAVVVLGRTKDATLHVECGGANCSQYSPQHYHPDWRKLCNFRFCNGGALSHREVLLGLSVSSLGYHVFFAYMTPSLLQGRHCMSLWCLAQGYQPQ